MNDECENCEHRKTIVNKMGREFDVCKNQCGKFVNNGNHPLSPCILLECYDDEFGEPPECETDEIYIMEGNRCTTYCAWLHFMYRHQETNEGKNDVA